jgi:hypothetical protein
MKSSISIAMIAVVLGCGGRSFGANPHFIKVSEHCYYLQLTESGENVAAVVTGDGVLLINPPQEPELSIAIDALKNITSQAVRWVIFTEPRLCRNSGARYFKEQNPIFLASERLRALSMPQAGNKANEPAAPLASSWLVFERQMRLFPSNLEIRIIALQHKARSGGDVVVFVPAEKVLIVGGLYEAARYPDIDTGSEGSAVEWFDGMKQVIDAVPMLKSAIPQARTDPKLDEDKKPEEEVAVLSSRGEASNLQNMKDMLESAKKLRSDISRSIRRGRTCDDFLASPGSDPYRSYTNLAPFAAQLFAEEK